MLTTPSKRDELQHRQRQIQAMRHTATVLSSQAGVDDILRETLALAVETLRADAGSLVMHNGEENTFTFRHVVGPVADRLIGTTIPVSGVAGRAFKTGQPILSSNTAEDPDQQRIAQLVGYQVASMMSVPLKNASGQPFGTMQILNAIDIFDSGDLEVLEVIGAVAAAAIEQARLAQEARRAELTVMVGDISHDIKNMLTPIQAGMSTLNMILDEMFARMAELEAECPPELRQRLHGITYTARSNYAWILENGQQSGEQVQALTREMADAVKGESAQPHFEVADLNDIVTEVTRAVRLVAQTVGVEFFLLLDVELPHPELDRRQIYNALYNLVSNALAATPPGGHITISTRKSEGNAVEMEVKDSGKGMSDKVRDRLFSPQAVSTKVGGTGLGTKIVGDVVRRHNGRIQVHSVEGQGSTFTIHLPLCQ